MLRQIRLLYCRRSFLVRFLNKCSKTVHSELCFTVLIFRFNIYVQLHSIIYWIQHRKVPFSKLRVAYNNVYRKILGLCRQSSASEMFVANTVSNFKALMRKAIFCIYQSLVNLQQIMPFFAQSRNLG